jgi:periplasmic protein TonB
LRHRTSFNSGHNTSLLKVKSTYTSSFKVYTLIPRSRRYDLLHQPLEEEKSLMNIRYFSAPPLGLVMTAVLLWVMQILIASGPDAYTTPRPRMELHWISLVPEEQEPIIKPPPKKPPPPRKAPPDLRESAPAGDVIGVPLSRPTAPLPTDLGRTDFGQSNAPLVDVMYVRPVYPVDAAARGLEGSVTVSFDVTELGTVTNVIVLESSHRIFERAAREAALRSKFRPRVVDGTAQGTFGVVRRYRFELED